MADFKTCYYGVAAPYAFTATVTLPPGNTDFDLTTATSAAFNVTVPGGTTTAWAATVLPQTTIAAASNGLTLPQASVSVASVLGLLPAGNVTVVTTSGAQIVAYTSIAGTALLGCTGGVGTMATGGNVTTTYQSTVRHVFAANGSDIPALTQPSVDYSFVVAFTTPTGIIYSEPGIFQATRRPGT